MKTTKQKTGPAPRGVAPAVNIQVRQRASTSAKMAEEKHRLDQNEKALKQELKQRTHELRQTQRDLDRSLAECRQAEKALEQKSLILEAVIANSAGPVFSVDHRYCYTSFNPQHAEVMKSLFGAKIEIGHNILEYHTNPADRLNARKNINRAFRGETVIVKSFAGEEALSRRYFEIIHNPIRSASNKVVGVVVQAGDITERELANAKIEEQRLRAESLAAAAEKHTAEIEAVFNALTDSIIVYGDDEIATRANAAAKAMLGFDPTGVDLARNMATAGTRRGSRTSVTARALRGEPVMEAEFDYHHTKGELRTVTATSIPMCDAQGRIIGAVTVFRDITARKQAEIDLKKAQTELELRVQERTRQLAEANEVLRLEMAERKQAETQLRLQTSAMEAAANGIIITDNKGSILWCNPAFARMTGYRYEEVVGWTPRFLKSGWQDEAFYKNMWQTLLNKQVWHGEMVNRRKDGSLYTEEQIITPLSDEQNQITHFIAIKQDIGARKKAEEELRLANVYNRSLIEASLDPLVTITPEGKIGDVNKATEKVTGYIRTELIGTDFHSYFSDPDKARLGYQQVFDSGTVRDYELEIRNKDGSVTPVLYNASVYRDETETVLGVFAVARDITDRKQFETQLVQAEKHAVIGRMVGSITHEINNPLQTIKNCLYLIQQDVTPGNPIQKPLEMASSETLRITNLVGQLRELYRPKVDSQKGPHEILDVLEEAHSLLIPHLNNAGVKWQPLSGLQRCYINCVRDQILEVFLNICTNAIEAMQSHGGTLFVNMNVSEERAAVIFKDTGPGIPIEMMPHLFEPFMTTKTKGLGLGLSIIYGIVQRHGGQILVDNQPGQGATFTILLPRKAQPGGKEEIQHGNK